MIEIRSVCMSYGDTRVVDEVSLDLPAGGLTAIVGPNGAGKSTLLSIVGRLITPESGSVTVDGLDVATVPGDVLAKRLAILRQDNHVPVRLTVRELVGFGRFPHNGGRPTDADAEHVERALAEVGMTHLGARRLDQLSGGQRQRAFIAAVLCQDTDYVLLDEPLNSLDLRHAIETMRVVRTLADELAKTVIVVLHDINIAAGHADRIVAMRDGRVVADGRPDEIVTEPVLRSVFDADVAVREVDGRPVALPFGPHWSATTAAPTAADPIRQELT